MTKKLAEDFKPTVEVTASWPYRIVRTTDDARDLISELTEYDEIAFDTEFNGEEDDETGMQKGYPVGMSFCCHDGMSWYVPFGHTTGEQQLLPDDVRELFGPIFADPKKTWVMHNGKVELHTLHKLGVEMKGQIWDTMLAAYMMYGIDTYTKRGNPPQRYIGLKPLAKEKLGLTWCTFKELTLIHEVVGERQISKGKNEGKTQIEYNIIKLRTDQVPIERMAPYATADAVATLGLYKNFRPKLDNWPFFAKIKECFYKWEMPFIRVLFNMETRGITLDTDYLREYRKQLRAKRSQLKQEMVRQLPRQDINLGSTKDLRWLFFEHFKFQPKKVSEKTGAPSTDADTIGLLIEEHPDHPFLKIFAEYREVEKIIGTYLDAYLGTEDDPDLSAAESLAPMLGGVDPEEDGVVILSDGGKAEEEAKTKKVKVKRSIVSPDGKIRCDFRHTGTRTGRLSSAEPNLQNINRQEFDEIKGEDGKVIMIPKPGLRMAFVADKGNTMVVADYSQIELRLLAHYARDKYMIEAYMKGIDLHKFCASIMFNTPIDKLEKWMRQAAKTIGFGIIYGMGPGKLANQLKISKEKAKELYENYYSNFVGVKHFVEAVKIKCRQGAVVDAGKGLKQHEMARAYYVPTILGRRRYLPNINHRPEDVLYLTGGDYEAARKISNGIRAYAERQAVNTIIQGSAADVCKIAMVLIEEDATHPEGVLYGLGYKLLSQVHDEVIGECPEENGEKALARVRELMEGVGEMLGIRVPIVAEGSTARTWAEAK